MRIVGPAVAVAGLLVIAFHRRFVRLTRRLPSRNQERVERQLPWLFKPTASGHVRVLWIISVGWVLIGLVWTSMGYGVGPLALE